MSWIWRISSSVMCKVPAALLVVVCPSIRCPLTRRCYEMSVALMDKAFKLCSFFNLNNPSRDLFVSIYHGLEKRWLLTCEDFLFDKVVESDGLRHVCPACGYGLQCMLVMYLNIATRDSVGCYLQCLSHEYRQIDCSLVRTFRLARLWSLMLVSLGKASYGIGGSSDLSLWKTMNAM